MVERSADGLAALDWARSGIVGLTGHPAGPALVPPGRAASVAAVLGRRLGVDGAALLAERAAFTGHRRAGRVSAGGSCRLVPLADGWAAVSCARPDDPALLGALVEHELSDDDPWPRLTAALSGMPAGTVDERAELLGVPARSLTQPLASAPAPAPVDGPLRSVRGLRVVSFGALWAAPLCAQLLAARGAQVVTVETPGRLDGARKGEPRFYDLLHAADRSVVLDPALPADRRALHVLVDAADIVIEASRPRALRGFGIEAEDAVARGATWLSITAAGRSSPRVGFGDDVSAAAGLVARDAEGGPVFVGDAIADPLAGLTAAAVAVDGAAAGVLHDISMFDVVAATLDGSPGGPVRAPEGDDGGWVDALGGPVRAAAPRARPVPGRAPAPGTHTAEVLKEIGIR